MKAGNIASRAFANRSRCFRQNASSRERIGERRLPAWSRRQLADDIVHIQNTKDIRVPPVRFSASCRKEQAGSLCSPEPGVGPAICEGRLGVGRLLVKCPTKTR